jgi:4'-phosphopantetheinyl transferase
MKAPALITRQPHVWLIPLNCNETLLANKFNSLAAEEKQRAQRFHFPIHKQRFIAAHSAMREILSRYTQIPAAEISYTYTENNKPYLENHAIKFNLSHSDVYGVLALSQDIDIGIDIEKIQPHAYLDIAARFFTQEETQMIAKAAQPQETFYLFWAKKEAILKATGQGFRLALNSFQVTPTLQVEEVQVDDRTYSLAALRLQPEYQAALAHDAPIEKIFFQNFNL